MTPEGAPSRTADVLIVNEKGIHTRTATELVKLTQAFRSTIRISVDGATADGKSVIELLTLGARKGKTLRIEAEGPDQAQAVERIVRLVRSGFSETGA